MRYLVSIVIAFCCTVSMAWAADTKPAPAAGAKAVESKPVEVDSLALLEKAVARD